MRLIFALLMLGVVPAFADSSYYAPVARPSAALPGVYQSMTPVPTAAPTPYAGDISVARVVLFQPNMSLELRGGAALPFGNMAKYNTAGYSAGVDLIYGASPIVDAAFSMTYASMPYSLTTAAQPQTSTGVGVKAIVHILKQEKLTVSVDGGMGYYFEDSATNPVVGTDAQTGLPILGTVYKTEGGIGFNIGVDVGYNFTPKFAATLQADAVQISLDGGTGTTSLYMTPDVGVVYTF